MARVPTPSTLMNAVRFEFSRTRPQLLEDVATGSCLTAIKEKRVSHSDRILLTTKFSADHLFNLEDPGFLAD